MMNQMRRGGAANKRRRKGLNSKDFISRMPDDILLMVLCLLPIKEAAVTSILSTRWRFLWSNLTKLNFDAREALDDIFNDFELYFSKLSEYAKQVNGVIMSYVQPRVHHFRIHFCLDAEYTTLIDKWLRFAINKKVEILELDFETPEENYDMFCYDFPSRLPFGNRPHDVISIPSNLESLKKLHLNNVNIMEPILSELLTKSPHLETLSIHESSFLNHIHVGGRNLNLKHVEIVKCPDVESVYLSDFAIESFTYVGQPIDLSLSNLSNLKNVVMSQGVAGLSNIVFGQISSCVSTLQALSFKIYYPMKISKLRSISRLPNVKKLRLSIDVQRDNCLLNFASLVNVFPNLETFTIELFCFSPMGKRRKATRIVAAHHHEHLKLFQILGYYGGNGDQELVAYIIQNAYALKKIVIDPRSQAHKGIKVAKNFLENEEAARSSARVRLPPMLPQGVELVIL